MTKHATNSILHLLYTFPWLKTDFEFYQSSADPPALTPLFPALARGLWLQFFLLSLGFLFLALWPLLTLTLIFQTFYFVKFPTLCDFTKIKWKKYFLSGFISEMVGHYT